MVSRKSRSRKSLKRSKRSTRKSLKRSKRSTRSKRGGFVAAVSDRSMEMPLRDSLAQGGQYLSLHKGQYGGVAPYSSLGETLPSNMVASARTGPLDFAISSIRGMQDGGRKSRKGRGHRGGNVFQGSPLSANSMLLPPGLERSAALNHEWSMAKDLSNMVPN